MPPKIGDRGRLLSGVPPQSKEFFNCVVANCDESIRDDRIVKHFQTSSYSEFQKFFQVKGRILPMPPNGKNYLTQENAGISSK